MPLAFGDGRNGPLIQPRPLTGGSNLPIGRGVPYGYGGAGFGSAGRLARLRFSGRRPQLEGETLPGVEPGQPRKLVPPEDPYYINPFKNYPGFDPLEISPEAMAGRVGRKYIPGGQHYLPPEQRQRLSSVAIAARGLRLGGRSEMGQGFGVGGIPGGDILRRLLLERGYQ